MSDEIDIVDRLRIVWTSMTEMGNAEREEAADEIERLRAQLEATELKLREQTARSVEAAFQIRSLVRQLNPDDSTSSPQ